MARKSFIKDGVLCWNFSVHVRSKVNPRVRIHKKRNSVPLTAEEAEKYEQNLWRLCSLEAARRECQGIIWEDLFEKWDRHYAMNPTKRWSESTRRDMYARLRNWTKPLFNKIAQDLVQGDIEDCLRLAEFAGASFKVRREIRRSIDAVFKWGMNQKYILGKDFSPCMNVELDPSPEDISERVPLIMNKQEIERFLTKANEVGHPWFPVWFFALHTGMRASEINALRKEKIELVPIEKAMELDQMADGLKKNYGRVRVQLSWDKRLGRNGPTKARWWRTVPVNSTLYWFLHEHLKTARYGSDLDGERVFQSAYQWDRGEQSKVVKEFCETYGLKLVTFHTLRACFATQMFEAGVDMTSVMKIGGWKDVKTVMVYVRLAGVDEVGKTEGLSFGSDSANRLAAVGNVVNLFGSRK